MTEKIRRPACWMLLFLLTAWSPGFAQESGSILDQIAWQKGPSLAAIGEIAQIQVPEGYVFAGPNDTRLLMEAMQNPTSGTELGFIAPDTLDWFIVFEFDDIGYVKDDEKNSLDADAMLKSIKSGTERANEERKRRGWPLLTIVGWEQPPRYNPATNNLEWGIRGTSEGDLVINYNTRILGRGGVMRVALVTGPENIETTIGKFRSAMSGFSFAEGHRYAEFRQGDKIAKYGLSALVVGGATAVAVKSGLFKWIWKLGVVAVVAVGGFFRRLFRGKANA